MREKYDDDRTKFLHLLSGFTPIGSTTAKYLNMANELLKMYEAARSVNEQQELEIVQHAWQECTKRICIAAGFDFEGMYFPIEPGHWLNEYKNKQKQEETKNGSSKD